MWSNSCLMRGVRPRDRKTFITVVILGTIICAFLLAYTVSTKESSSSTVSLVIILFRHGEKVPSSYPNDPYRSREWPEGVGELTNKGKLQLFESGRNLRKRYKGFLSDLYSDSEVHMQSSYASRCQMSAQALLAGLFPPMGPQVWNPDLLWQPIPVNPIPRKYDNMIAAKADCPAFHIEKEKSDETIRSERTEADKELLQYLTKHTGKSVNNISDVESLFSVLMTQREMGLMLPKWTETVFPEPMKQLAALNLASYSRTPVLRRLQAGPLIGEWSKLLKAGSVSGSSHLAKMNLYLGHDLTLVNALSGLGLTRPPAPPLYGAALALELHSIHEHHFVSVFYFETGIVEEAKTIAIPGCDIPCALDTFLHLVAPVTPQNWSKECQIE